MTDTSILSLGHYQKVLSESNLKKGDSVIFCDIDGTVFRDSLYIEIFLGMVYDRMSQGEHFVRELAKRSLRLHEDALGKWKNRECGYDDYLHVVLDLFTDLVKGMPEGKFNSICEGIVEEKSKRTYVFPMTYLKERQSEGYKVILVSGSPDHIVRNFAKTHGFDVGMGSFYFKDENGLLTGEKALLAISKSKEEIVNYVKETYEVSRTAALGDTNGDFKMLTMADEGIAMNPSFELYSKIKDEKSVTVVVERKDLILVMDSEARRNVSFFDNKKIS